MKTRLPVVRLPVAGCSQPASVAEHLQPYPEPGRLLSRPAGTLSSIPNGGEGRGEEAPRLQSRRAAFTLVEIMIVVAILGIMLGIGIPSMFRSMKREGIRAAASDVLEACAKARAAAILSGSMIELQILTESRQFNVVAASQPPPQDSVLDPVPVVPELAQEEPRPARPAFAPFSVTLVDSIRFELIDVNFLELKDAPEVRVRFHPNGTSDEFTIVLRSESDEWRKISLEVTTALATMEVIK
jgi:prepilin-type N-terminal cleavage/methylation domain-containing protein